MTTMHRSELGSLDLIDLVALARHVLAEVAPFSVERAVDVAFETSAESITVQGDTASLREGLSNIIHKALTHTAATALVVRVGRDAGSAWVEVIDDGPGIPAADWDRIGGAFTVLSTIRREDSRIGAATGRAAMKAQHSGVIFRERTADGYAVILRMACAETTS